MRDNDGITLSAWTQATEKLILKPNYESPTTDYVTFYRELIERAPIIQKDRIRQATNALEEDCQAWTDTVKAANPIIWEQLFRMPGEIDVWNHEKVTQRLRNGFKAYYNISMYLFG